MPPTVVAFAPFFARGARLNAVTSNLTPLALRTTQGLAASLLFRGRFRGFSSRSLVVYIGGGWSRRGRRVRGGVSGRLEL